MLLWSLSPLDLIEQMLGRISLTNPHLKAYLEILVRRLSPAISTTRAVVPSAISGGGRMKALAVKADLFLAHRIASGSCLECPRLALLR
jgi:hypothetical protein